MTRTDEATLVVSRDGTEIAYWSSGEGAPLLLVHGTTADHTRWLPLVPYLRGTEVCMMDRRGRGASGDGPGYDLAREFEDVAAVVDAIAERSGCPVDVLGHSYGGECAFGAAALTSNIGRLVLYEGWPQQHPHAEVLPPGIIERMNSLLTAGEREKVLELMFREVVGMPDAEFAAYRALPVWQVRIAAAHTIPREFAVNLFHPDAAAKITVPVLLLVGGDSPDLIKADYETVAAALPDARVSIFEGQGHVAMDFIPDVFAERVLAFLGRTAA
ncbi:probable hydrolase [Alloactinosynnema sp. L-07]|uniref:alpha/beta fold hydrolase n=1 Tax=Alloactinosynnema sp. L-07 TaxID=1653480 RepID=UPI00065EF104|nr:alpha/beta hydrolase [Alloactinosynnema sp. L-07]CRK55014.1 probable hydrolase [Alloactinosynnema sp. L-07]